MKTSRRGLLAALPSLALAQQQQAVAQDKPTREQDLDNARSAAKSNADALSKFKLPQAVEPAFLFKA
jgi:hypothetical protein